MNSTLLRLATLLPVFLVLACCDGGPSGDPAAADPGPAPLAVRDRSDPGDLDPVQNALGIWRHGSAYIHGEDLGRSVPQPLRLGGWARAFLDNPSLTPSVQFSCCPSVGQDLRVKAAMLEGEDSERLVGLALLMKVRAAESVAEQRETLRELTAKHPEWAPALTELGRAFDPEEILTLLAAAPPTDRYAPATAHCWAAGAAAATGTGAAIPRLGELSTLDVLDLSLAAVKSLMKFPSEAADHALAKCLLGWQYDAFEHAARALRERNPAVLHQALLSAPPPKDCKFNHAVFLAWCDDPGAVPILCETAHGIYHGAKWNVDFFALIERLATKDQLEVVEALPESVRPDQRRRAEEVVRTVMERLMPR